VRSVHDVSSGGLALCLAECTLSGVGASVWGIADHRQLFSESAGRVVLCTTDAPALLRRAEEAQVAGTVIGRAGGSRLVVEGLVDLDVAELRRRWQGALPDALGDTVPAVN